MQNTAWTSDLRLRPVHLDRFGSWLRERQWRQWLVLGIGLVTIHL